MSHHDQICSGCGLPPRQSSKTGTPLALKRCSSCKNAWYHDIKCQKTHFPEHREKCRQQRAAVQVAAVEEASCYHIERREDRGRCVFASRSITFGEPIAPQDFFHPIVAPVLNADQRWHRCAVCFHQVSDSTRVIFEDTAHSPCYVLCFCSRQCRKQGKSLSFLDEEKAVVAVCSSMKEHQSVMPTSILLFRIMFLLACEESRPQFSTMARGRTTASARIADLQPNGDNISLGKDDEKLHAHAVVSFATRLLQYSSKYGTSLDETSRIRMASFSAEYITGVLSKVKTNSFSICDGESVAMGLGLFPLASSFNHSCEPNAIQTFMYGVKVSLPRLRISACSDIQAKQEICISYIDCTCPRDVRREQLNQGYNFWCMCSACTDDAIETKMVALRCERGGCLGRGIRQPATAGASAVWMCDTCSATNFRSAHDSIRKFVSNEHASDVRQDYASRLECCSRAETLYKDLKSTCYPTSHYVKTAGERLVQSYLDSLCDIQSESERRDMCSKALVIAEEVLSTYNNGRSEGWTTVHKNKLQLFLLPNPLQALQELQDVYKNLSLFFPRNHELMEGLRCCMEQSSM